MKLKTTLLSLLFLTCSAMAEPPKETWAKLGETSSTRFEVLVESVSVNTTQKSITFILKAFPKTEAKRNGKVIHHVEDSVLLMCEQDIYIIGSRQYYDNTDIFDADFVPEVTVNPHTDSPVTNIMAQMCGSHPHAPQVNPRAAPAPSPKDTQDSFLDNV